MERLSLQKFFSFSQALKFFRQYLFLRTVILQKKVTSCPCFYVLKLRAIGGSTEYETQLRRTVKKSVKRVHFLPNLLLFRVNSLWTVWSCRFYVRLIVCIFSHYWLLFHYSIFNIIRLSLLSISFLLSLSLSLSLQSSLSLSLVLLHLTTVKRRMKAFQFNLISTFTQYYDWRIARIVNGILTY